MINGSVDKIDAHKIRGWCIDNNDKGNRLTVELFIDGNKVAEQKANLFREDLGKRKNIPNDCAFTFLLPENIIYEGQKIEIRTNGQALKSRYKYLLGEENNEKINRIQIYGERASGTNFLKQLLLNNIPNTAHTNQYGWKHFFPPADFPNSDNCLFIVIYRNPFDWLRSLYLQPHHTHSSLQNISFSEFIRTEWQCIWDELANVTPTDEKFGKEMMFERNPDTGERFENVIKLRNAKNKAFQILKQKVKNIEFIRYEDLLEDPFRLIKKIKKKYNVPTSSEFITIDTYKGITEKPFIPKEYEPISENDFNFITNNLDQSLEKQIGYNEYFLSQQKLKSIKTSSLKNKIEQIVKNTLQKKVKKKKLVLHVGTPKTGSSALQAFLFLNDQILKKYRVNYPINYDFNQAFQTSSGNAYKLATHFEDKNTEEIEQFIQSNIFKNHTTLLSSEALYQSLKKNPSYFFNSLKNYDFKIICYVRRQDNAYQSIINQLVKNHNLILNEKIFTNLDSYDFDKVFLNALNYVDKKRIIIRPYEKSQFIGGSIYSDFLNCLNIPWNNRFKIPEEHVNPSLNHEALFFRSFLNEIGIDRGNWNEKVAWNKTLQEYSVKQSFGKPFLEHKLYNASQRKEILEKYSNQNSLIAKIFLNREDGILFREEIPETNIIHQEIKKPKEQNYISLLNYIQKNENHLFLKLHHFLYYQNYFETDKTENSIFLGKIINDNYTLDKESYNENIRHNYTIIKYDNYKKYISKLQESTSIRLENNKIMFCSTINNLWFEIDLPKNETRKITAYIIDILFECSKQTKISFNVECANDSSSAENQVHQYHVKKGEGKIRTFIEHSNMDRKIKINCGKAPITVLITHIQIHYFEK